MALSSFVRARLIGSAAALFAIVAVPCAHAVEDPSGDLDSTFNTIGTAVTNVTTRATYSDAGGTAVQSDGRIVVAGAYDAGGGITHISLTRYNPDGSVDGSFGNGGEVKTTIGSNDIVTGVGLQSDGKIIVVGSANLGGVKGEDFFVARYTNAGVLDATYNSGVGGTPGYKTIEIGVNAGTPAPQAVFDRAQAVAIQSDDKVVVVGYSDNNIDNGVNNFGRDWSLARLNTDGTLDTSFDTDGKQIFHFAGTGTSGADRILAVTIQPADQKIVVAGRGTSTQLGVARLNTNGSLDTSFNGTGLFLGSPPGGSGADRFQAIKIDSSNRIVGAGYFYDGTKGNMLVGRINANGTIDTSFDSDGYATTDVLSAAGQDQCRVVAIQADGKIICSGMADADNSGLFRFMAVRFTTAGALDTTFNGTGKFTIDPSGTGNYSECRAGAIQGDGKFLLVGTSYPPASTTATQISIVRLTTGGVLDNTFDGDGISFRQLLGGSPDFGYGVAVQSDNKVVVVGSTADGTSGNIVLARYNVNGTLDTSFDTDGLVITGAAATTYNESGRGVLIQPDGKIVVGGDEIGQGSPAPPHKLMALRYLTSGALDTSFDTDGIALAPLGTNGGAGYAVARDASGNILVAGSITDVSTEWDFAVARWSAAGVLDTGFGTNGVARINVSSSAVDEAYAMAIQPDGKIVLAGYAYVGSKQYFALVRLTTAGVLDPTFGTGGKVITPMGAGANPRNRAQGVVVMPDGSIIAGGTGNDGGASDVPVFRTARYTSAGVLDTTYGTAGVSSFTFGGGRFDNGYAISRQYDDKIVLFGNSITIPAGQQDFAIARFNWDDGSLDTTYGDIVARPGVGQVITPITPGLDSGYAGVVMADGRQVIAGQAQQSDLGVARYLSDPNPVLPSVPDLTTDSGGSSTDNLTNVKRPTFAGTCNTGDTVWLKIDGNTTTPFSRAICRSGAYSVSAALDIADGVHTASVFARNGKGDTATTGTLSFTIDTVALPVSISAPAANANILPNPTISGAGTENPADVTVKEAGNTVCTHLAATGSWTCNSTLGQGLHTVDVTQLDFAGNTSAPTSRTFRVKLATTAAVTTSKTPTVFGESVTFTATISASGGTPDGSVAFSIDGGAAQNVTLDGTGKAQLTTSALAVGAHTVAVTYAETLGYFASNTTLSGGQTVNKANTTTAVSGPGSATLEGGNVTLTANLAVVSPGAGTLAGTVDFAVDGSTATGCAAVAVSSSAATCGPKVYAVGTHAVIATYSGNASFNGSSNAVAFNFSVKPAAPGTPALAAGSDSGQSASDRITNAILPVFTGACVTGDSIQMVDGASPSSAPQTCAASTYNIGLGLSEGAHTITAIATRNSVPSDASTGVSVTIDRTALAPVINAPATPVVSNPTVSGTGEAGATVTLKEGATTLCTTTVIAGGTWSCNTTMSGVGIHNVSATQQDIAGNTSTASADFPITIDRIFLGNFE